MRSIDRARVRGGGWLVVFEAVSDMKTGRRVVCRVVVVPLQADGLGGKFKLL